ncbi:hypothetical protein N7468_010576 [Penicillium chermesinum]|uniref:Major facilitator superfamily (MFS) profile domain-containing protein n=1 Tax=Penicillium chermesinum TaxID=63820 RepID=A0A9W9N803_9EURO|nr:uncharacterized protein N7468_010576 [Penicillium chermesinum]KAJ5214897.1 hypothetical protein N7468_010576 [Penicillium chermesinum]
MAELKSSRKDLESQRPLSQLSTPRDSDTEPADKEPKESPPPGGFALPLWRKSLILFVVSWMTLSVTFSSTSLLPAVPEIGAEFHTSDEHLNVVNSGVLIAMGFSFIAMRILSGFCGTFFMVAGQTIIADIFEPVVRGTATGVMMVGSVSGPAIGPCIGGIIVTFTHWRIIYWLQFAMTVLGLILSLLFLPDLEVKKTVKEPQTVKYVLSMFNPWHILRPLLYPNIFLSSLLRSTSNIPVRHPHLCSPSIQPSLPPYHAPSERPFLPLPGIGFLIGSIVGGKLSDRAVVKWIRKRNGVRLPQDRLNSGLITLLLVLPGGTLVYGWTLQEKVGGMPVPIIAAFFAGVGLLGSFNGLNTYASEVIPQFRSEVVGGKYAVQLLFAAGSTAAVEPLIKVIGVGWTFTICAVFAIISGFNVFIITRWGIDMQRWAERKFPLSGTK